MKSAKIICALAAFFIASVGLFAEDTQVSKKQDIAVFALGSSGYSIPLETLATVDAEILGVFVNLGRFNVLGQNERFAAKDVQAFTQAIQDAKRNNTPLPEEVRFGEVQMTEALMNKLFGAFVVVIPTVVDYNSGFNDSKNQYETTIKTSVAFLNVAEGTTIGYANITTSGSSKETQYRSIQSALAGIAFQLSFEIRKISAFTINTTALKVGFTEVKMKLGANMGVQVGDEYVVIDRTELGGLLDEREDGLILIKNVGPEISTGTILYAGGSLGEGSPLREVPRLGVDIEPYLRYLSYFNPVRNLEQTKESNGALVVGIRGVASRGFYNIRPLLGFQANLDPTLWIPLAGYFGVEYNIHLRRLALGGSAAVGGATNVVFKLIEENVEKATDSGDDEPIFSHYGIILNAGMSFLINRDMRIFAEGGIDAWFGLLSGVADGPFASYAGAGVSVGVAFKM